MEKYSFLFELEKKLHSTNTRSDKHELMKLLSPTFFEFGSSDQRWSRKEVIARLPLENEEYQIQSSHYKAHELSPDVVLVTYTSSRGSKEESLRSSIWKKNTPNEWQMG